MASNTLIRVITGKQKPTPRSFTFKCVTGKRFDRVVRVHKVVDIQDLALDPADNIFKPLAEVLSESELETLYSTPQGEHLRPHDEPEPLPLSAEVVAEELTEKVEEKEEEKPISEQSTNEILDSISDEEEQSVEEVIDSLEEESEEDDYSDLEVPELKELLTEKDIKFDGRKRKKEYFIELLNNS
jgi:hypothetical protein